MGNARSARRDRLGDLTRRVFEARAGRRLNDEDVREIAENLGGFFAVLGDWARAERQKPAPSLAGDVDDGQ
jgi:hypothetical protein